MTSPANTSMSHPRTNSTNHAAKQKLLGYCYAIPLCSCQWSYQSNRTRDSQRQGPQPHPKQPSPHIQLITVARPFARQNMLYAELVVNLPTLQVWLSWVGKRLECSLFPPCTSKYIYIEGV